MFLELVCSFQAMSAKRHEAFNKRDNSFSSPIEIIGKSKFSKDAESPTNLSDCLAISSQVEMSGSCFNFFIDKFSNTSPSLTLVPEIIIFLEFVALITLRIILAALPMVGFLDCGKPFISPSSFTILLRILFAFLDGIFNPCKISSGYLFFCLNTNPKALKLPPTP